MLILKEYKYDMKLKDVACCLLHTISGLYSNLGTDSGAIIFYNAFLHGGFRLPDSHR